MAALTIIALLCGVAGAVTRPFRLPAWVLPVVAAVVVLVAGGLSLAAARHALSVLGDPLAFLLSAVPLAVLLDRLGFFAVVAELVTERSQSVGGLWILAALVTTVLNLDASVVLLTPLYVSIARRTGRDPLVLAAQPVLLACLASSALPVSNLTNLIAVAATGASTGAFLEHLALPSFVAVTVGWFRYRAVLRSAGGIRASAVATGRGAAPAGRSAPGDHRGAVLALGGTVVVLVLVGFTLGRLAGIQPWEVALGADAVLLVAEIAAGADVARRRFEPRAVARVLPWRAVPVGTALVAGGLAVLAAAAALHLPVDRLVGGTSVVDMARTTGAAAVGANVVNNLPALLVALPAIGHRASPALWAVLLGVNMGPVLLATGSLASLLWLDALRRLDVPVRAVDFSRLGWRVGLPAGLAGVATALVLSAVGIPG